MLISWSGEECAEIEAGITEYLELIEAEDCGKLAEMGLLVEFRDALRAALREGLEAAQVTLLLGGDSVTEPEFDALGIPALRAFR